MVPLQARYPAPVRGILLVLSSVGLLFFLGTRTSTPFSSVSSLSPSACCSSKIPTHPQSPLQSQQQQQQQQDPRSRRPSSVILYQASNSNAASGETTTEALGEKDDGNDENDEDQTVSSSSRTVPVTIRYSAESGLKPYYLTVAKRVTDLYPDVVIESVEVQSDNDNGNSNKNNHKKTDDDTNNNSNNNNSNNKNGSGGNGASSSSTFEVIVDGKIVVRKSRREHDTGSVFVSMNEVDVAVVRARKRLRRSSSGGETSVSTTSLVYSESGGSPTVFDKAFLQDQIVKSRLEALKNKSLELKRMQESAASTATAMAISPPRHDAPETNDPQEGRTSDV